MLNFPQKEILSIDNLIAKRFSRMCVDQGAEKVLLENFKSIWYRNENSICG